MDNNRPNVRRRRRGAHACLSSLIVCFVLCGSISGTAAEVKVYSWTATPHTDVIIPMTWVERLTRDGRAAVVNPAIAAELVIQRRQTETRDLVLLFGHDMPGAFDLSDPARLVAEGPFIEEHVLWYRRFFGRLANAGIVPERIVLDQEEGLSVWHLFKDLPCGDGRVQIMRQIYDDPAARRRLPDHLKQFAPEDFRCHTGRGRDAYIAWNAWAAEQRAAALRTAIRDTANETFGQRIPISNYEDQRPAYEVYDANGWPVQDAMVDEIASPQCYLIWGQRHRDLDDPLQLRLQDILDYVRANQQAGVEVAPWVSSPSYTGPWGRWTYEGDPERWEQMIRRMHATGVRTFLYWNTGPGQQYYNRSPRLIREDDAFAAEVFRSLQPAATGDSD